MRSLKPFSFLEKVKIIYLEQYNSIKVNVQTILKNWNFSGEVLPMIRPMSMLSLILFLEFKFK